jgi:hypothetical protein
MTPDRILLLILFASSIVTICYVHRAESDRRIGKLVREAVGGKDKAYQLITRLNIQNDEIDSMLKRACATALTPEEIAAFTMPAPGPAQMWRRTAHLRVVSARDDVA